MSRIAPTINDPKLKDLIDKLGWTNRSRDVAVKVFVIVNEEGAQFHQLSLQENARMAIEIVSLNIEGGLGDLYEMFLKRRRHQTNRCYDTLGE